MRHLPVGVDCVEGDVLVLTDVEGCEAMENWVCACELLKPNLLTETKTVYLPCGDVGDSVKESE